MILIGQYDSPFVRRVGIALRLYRLEFEHRPLSVFGDGEEVRALNPLMRVPALVLKDGMVLTDSHLILDHLDSLVPEPMFPRAEPARRGALRVAGLACGAAEKAVSLFYEYRLHEDVSDLWVDRCERQIGSVLWALEEERSHRPGPWWFGDVIGHADIAIACMLRFVDEAHPNLVDWDQIPHLWADAERAEALPVFNEISQSFLPPA